MKRKPSPLLTVLKTLLFFIQAAALIWTASLVLQSFRPRPLDLDIAEKLPPPARRSVISTAPPASEAAPDSPELTPPAAGVTPPADPGGPTALPNGIVVQPPTLCSPLKGVALAGLDAIISDTYHPPPPGHDARHMGVDFAFYTNADGRQIDGNEVNAVFSGQVAGVVFDRPPYGNMVLIETRYQDLPVSIAENLGVTRTRSLYHLYAHMQNAPSVDPGYSIRCGQFLGRVGESGASGNPHLHLEMRWGPAGSTFPVMAYDQTASPLIGVTEEEKTYYFTWRTSGTFEHFDPMDILHRGAELTQAQP